MEQLIQYLPKGRRFPRLWFERLAIFSEPDDAHVFRTIRFHRGLNLVWAKEPAGGNAQGTHAAGHGVGKTSLCLLLRFCLGDASDALANLRDELFGEFPLGGVIAVVYVDEQPFTLCRYFNAYKEGIAYAGADIASIWTHPAEFGDRAFLKKLADDMMSIVTPKSIPETGQAIEWRHLLAWSSRDQGARFKSFFAGRDGEGNLLQRRRQDPPIVMRAILGLLDKGESELLSQIADLEKDLKFAEENTEKLLQAPALIRRRIESNLRARGNLPDNLPIRSNDLFMDSVEKRIKAASDNAAVYLAQWERKQEEDDQAVADLRANLKMIQKEYDRAEAEYELAEAARSGNEDAFRAIGAQLVNLQNLAGDCPEASVPFSQCQYVKEKIQKLEESVSLRDARDRKNLQSAMNESITHAGNALARKNDLSRKLDAMKLQEQALLAAQQKTRIARRTAEVEANRWPDLLDELNRWESTSGSVQAQANIEESRASRAKVEQKLGAIRTQLTMLQKNRSAHERALSHITDGLTQKLLPDGAVGTFDPRDDDRPFRLSMRGGEAYRVLEVLLGDIACMLDSPSAKNALPGLFIHDCPREADMSTGLYENFLSLIDTLQRGLYSAGTLPFQYIVTTTTPPPVGLQGAAVCLTLDPSSDAGLLFCRRFLGKQQEDLH
jgi:hypothetical protein